MDSETNNVEHQKPKTRKKRMVLGIVIFVLGLVVLAGGITVFIDNQDTDSEGYVYTHIPHIGFSIF